MRKEQLPWWIRGDLRIHRSPVLSQTARAKPGELAALNASFVRNYWVPYSIFREWVYWRWVKDKALKWDLTCFLSLCLCGAVWMKTPMKAQRLRWCYLNTDSHCFTKMVLMVGRSCVLPWGLCFHRMVRAVRTTFSCFSKLLPRREAINGKMFTTGCHPREGLPNTGLPMALPSLQLGAGKPLSLSYNPAFRACWRWSSWHRVP